MRKTKTSSKRATRKTRKTSKRLTLKQKARRWGNSAVNRVIDRTPKKRKARKAKVQPLTDEQIGEAIALQDFNNEIKLNGWKAIRKTWTAGKIARFKASQYVKDLQNRIKDLGKKVVVFS